MQLTKFSNWDTFGEMSFREISGKAYEFFIGLALIGLTVYPKSVPGWLGFALIFGLLENRYIGRVAWKNLSKVTRTALILPIIFFILHLLGMIHTENISAGQADVIRRLTLIAVPFFVLIKGMDEGRLQRWMRYFLVGLTAALLWNNLQSYIAYAETGNTGHFFGDDAVSQMHIGYFALHLLVGVGIVVQRIFKYHLKNRNFAYGLGVLGLYIILNLILTGSKMGFLTLLTMLGVSLILMLSRGVGWKKVLISAAGILVILTVLVKQTSFLAKRFERMTVSTPIDPDTIESTQARRMCWICAKDVFLSNIWLGLGTGDTQDAMMECYEEKGFRGPASKELGPHSQYLESGIAAGILASITLFLMLFIPLLRAFQLKHIASTMFFLAFLMACVSESIFERAMGIHLYSVMLGIILIWMEMRRQDLLNETRM